MKANGSIEQKEEMQQVSTAKRGYVLGLLTFIWALSFLDRNVLSMVLDPIKKEFALSDTMLGAMIGLGFALIYLILSIPVARLADRKARTPIIGIGLVIWSVMTTLGGVARSALQMLIFRMGVGVGESASTAPALSLIADYFPKDRRPLATSIYNMAPNLGLYFGFLIGGIITQYYGWRAAFFFAGIPGLITAILLYFTVKEPPRGLSDGVRVDTKFYTLGNTISYFLKDKTLLLVLAGACLTAFTNFAGLTWNPSFFRRVHHLSGSQLGLIVGTVIGGSGIIGGLIAGAVTSALSKGRDRWKVLIPGLMLIAAGPVLIFQLLPNSLAICLIFLFIAQCLTGTTVGLQLAVVQTVVKVRMRAFASSLHFICSNLFGMAIAPLVVGIVNDALTPRFGTYAIRYSLLMEIPSSILAGLFLIWGSRYMIRDVKAALEEGTQAGQAGSAA
ncbi:MAG TPA: MFS transporter [Syntrophorhabdales bacterium]|nr:MFS transporter [Syntrophorhabdales bacterium]